MIYLYLCLRRQKEQHELAWKLFTEAMQTLHGVSLEDLEIVREEHGKPVSLAYPNLHFNLSHCKEGCVCAVCDRPIGVDLERHFMWKDSLMRKISHPEELKIMNQMTDSEKERHLRILWSLKESFVKWDGRGLGYGIEQISLAEILPVKKEMIRKLHTFDPVRIKDKEMIFRLLQTEDYTLAVCTEADKGEKGEKYDETRISEINI